MVKKHLKTLTVPTTWPIKRKEKKFIIRPLSGKKFSMAMPLSLIFIDMLKYCKTAKEVKTILRDKEIFVDGKRKKNQKDSLGVMDVLSIPLSKENYRMLINKYGKMCLISISDEESKEKVCKIIGKKVLKKGKTQLNLFDGRNILVKEDKYNIGDSVLIKLPIQEIKDSFKLEKGNYGYLTGGSHIGDHGSIESISKGMVTIKNKEGVFETPKEYVFVIGKTKPSIKMHD